MRKVCLAALLQVLFGTITHLLRLSTVHCQTPIDVELSQTTKDDFSTRRKRDLKQRQWQRAMRGMIFRKRNMNRMSSGTGMRMMMRRMWTMSKYSTMKSLQSRGKGSMSKRRSRRRRRRKRRRRRQGMNIFRTIEVNCSPDIQPFFSETVVDFEGNPDLLTDQEVAALENTFRETYNDLTFQRCDGFFRSIREVTLIVVPQAERQRRELQQDGETQRSTYRSVGTCRNCPVTDSGSFQLFDDSFRRTLVESKQQDPVSEHSQRNLHDVSDVCTCDADSFFFERRPNAPTEEEFLVAYNIEIEELVDEGIVRNIASLTTLEEVPINIMPVDFPSVVAPLFLPSVTAPFFVPFLTAPFVLPPAIGQPTSRFTPSPMAPTTFEMVPVNMVASYSLLTDPGRELTEVEEDNLQFATDLYFTTILWENYPLSTVFTVGLPVNTTLSNGVYVAGSTDQYQYNIASIAFFDPEIPTTPTASEIFALYSDSDSLALYESIADTNFFLPTFFTTSTITLQQVP